MTVTTEELIFCAEMLIKSPEPLSQKIEQIERYSKDFDVWYATFEEQVSKEDAPLVEKLLVLHNELISTAEVWLHEAGKEIGKQKQKSKVIMAYADVLPKRVSRRWPKKG